MANTYTQIYIHLVFSVKNRARVIDPSWRDELHKYIGGTLSNMGCKPLAIGGVADHIHILFIQHKTRSISEIVKDLKVSATRWINNNKFIRGHFEWQDGYGAFSVAPSILEATKKYIANQEEHHKSKSFRDEFAAFLSRYNIDFNEDYLP